MFTLSLFTQPTNTQTYDGKTFNRNDCEKTKGCLFHPPKCKLYNNCYYAFSYVTDSNRLYMEIYGNLNYVQADYGAYVAVGFSTDELMGMDTVTECSSFQGRPFQGRLSSNPGKSNRRVTVDEISHDIMLQTISSHYSNKTLYCLLSQSIYPINGIKDYYVRPLNEEYFLLFASGLTDGEELVVHALDVKLSNFPFVTQHPVNLKAFHADNLADLFNSTSLSSFNTTDIGEPSEGSFNKSAKVLRMDSTIDHATESHRSVRDRQQEGVHFQTRIRLTTAHGITMCFSWLVLVPLAILIARYGRRIWGPDKRLLNVPIWIHCHRLCNILACVIMTFSTVAIFAAHGWHWHGLEFTHGSTLDLHGFLGLFAVIFAWSQVLNSIFRCKLGSSLRKCHNFLHRTVGLVTVILGYTTLGLAIWSIFVESAAIKVAYVIYLVVIFGAVAMLEPLKWKLYCQRRRQQVQISEKETKKPAGNIAVVKKRMARNAAQKKQEAMVRQFQRVTIAICAVMATTITILIDAAIILRETF